MNRDDSDATMRDSSPQLTDDQGDNVNANDLRQEDRDQLGLNSQEDEQL